MREKLTVWALAFCAMSVWAALPHVDQDDVTLVQDSVSHLVTVTYTLRNAPAVVTLDIQTNVTGAAEGPWASIGAVNFRTAEGAVNRVVREVGVPQTITWKPYVSWPGGRYTDGRVRAVVTAWATNAPPDYMVVDLTRTNTVNFYVTADALPEGDVTNDLYRTDHLVMRKVHGAGAMFRMGGLASDDPNSAAYEIPHLVTLTNDYYLSVFTVTKQQYWRIMGGTQPSAADAVFPQTSISWNGIRGNTSWPSAGDFATAHAVGSGTFFDKLRRHAGLDWFDFATEACWEFACRAGTDYPAYCGQLDQTRLAKIAWYQENNPDGRMTPYAVGQLEPNAWGFYDMLGNGWELCLDWLSMNANYSDGSAVVEPVGCVKSASVSNKRAVRGGAVNMPQYGMRSAYRNGAGETQVNERYVIRLWHHAVVR